MRANHFVDVSQAIESLNLVAIPSHADAGLWCPVAQLNVLSHIQRVDAGSFEECFVLVYSLRESKKDEEEEIITLDLLHRMSLKSAISSHPGSLSLIKLSTPPACTTSTERALFFPSQQQ
jgi:hypothetical protein